MKFSKSQIIEWTILTLIIVLGIILRSFAYFSNLSFWVDEDALIRNSILAFNSTFDIFKHLEAEIAPPILLLSTNILYKIFGLKEIVLRFIPYISSLAALILFVKLCNKTINFVPSKLAAIFLFAINYNLLFNTQYFKHYSSDVLFVIIFLILILNFDTHKLNYKKALTIGITTAISIWASFSIMFMLLSFSFVYLIKFLVEKNKYLLKCFAIYTIPNIISAVTYYIINLNYSFHNKELYEMWHGDSSVFYTSISNLLNNLIYYQIGFGLPPELFISLLIMFALGVYLMARKNLSFTMGMILPLLMMIILARFEIYPFEDRLTLYLYPILLIITVKSTDITAWKEIFKNKYTKLIGIFIGILTISGFYIIFSRTPDINNISLIINNKNFFRMSTAREFYTFLSKYPPQEGEMVYSSGRDAALRVYDFKKHLIKENQLEEVKDFYTTMEIAKPNQIWYIYLLDYPYMGHLHSQINKYIHTNYKVIIEEKDSTGGVFLKFKNEK